MLPLIYAWFIYNLSNHADIYSEAIDTSNIYRGGGTGTAQVLWPRDKCLATPIKCLVSGLPLAWIFGNGQNKLLLLQVNKNIL